MWLLVLRAIQAAKSVLVRFRINARSVTPLKIELWRIIHLVSAKTGSLKTLQVNFALPVISLVKHVLDLQLAIAFLVLIAITEGFQVITAHVCPGTTMLN